MKVVSDSDQDLTPDVHAAVEAYWQVCETELQMQKIENWEEKVERERELQLKWKAILSRLMEIAPTPDAEVWHAIGDAFDTGRGAERNREEAMRWFCKAAETGHSKAMVRLGICLKCPKPKQDIPSAIDWFRRAAALGNPRGMVFLGFAYREGSGVSCDPNEAVKWFTKAAEAGDRIAYNLAGRMYVGSLGMPVEAEKWFLRGAEAGSTESYIHLARLYDDRKSPAYDPVKAVKWHHAVAEGSAGCRKMSMMALARHYRDGIGVERAPKIAQEWVRRLLEIAPEKSAARSEAVRLLAEMQADLL